MTKRERARDSKTPALFFAAGVATIAFGSWTFNTEPVGASLLVFCGLLCFGWSYQFSSFRVTEVFER